MGNRLQALATRKSFIQYSYEEMALGLVLFLREFADSAFSDGRLNYASCDIIEIHGFCLFHPGR